MKNKFSMILCIMGACYGLVRSFEIEDQAQSIMHQIYSGQYSMIAAMFFCTLMIIDAISNK